MSVNQEVFDCQKCAEAARKAKACDGTSKMPVFNIDGEDFFQCPAKVVEPWTRLVYELYTHYRNGYLPYSGGVMQQPAKLMRAFSVIGGALAEAEAEKAKKRK